MKVTEIATLHITRLLLVLAPVFPSSTPLMTIASVIAGKANMASMIRIKIPSKSPPR